MSHKLPERSACVTLLGNLPYSLHLLCSNSQALWKDATNENHNRLICRRSPQGTRNIAAQEVPLFKIGRIPILKEDLSTKIQLIYP